MKSLLRIRRKSLPLISLILLLTISTAMVSVAKADPGTVLSVEPFDTPEPSDTFTVDIKITNITALWSMEFKLWYNSTLINATDVIPGPVMTGGTYIEAVENLAVAGRVWYGWSFLAKPSYNGTGVVATISFTALDIGLTTIHLNDTLIGNDQIPSQPIPHTTQDTSVEVVPEFPAILVMPLLIIATLIATFLGKNAWSKKRRGPAAA